MGSRYAVTIKHVTYECEICHESYKDLAKAQGCEAQGKATEYPIGLIFNYRNTDNGWGKTTFAVARNSLRKHYNYTVQ